MKKASIASICIFALVAFFIWAPDAQAYQFYSDATNDQGGCAQCHTGYRDNSNYVSNAEDGFAWGTSLHNAHLNNTDIDSSCDNCHGGTGTAGRTVNLSSSANAADGVNAISCAGCHGRLEDANTVAPVNGAGWGAGLRQHHFVSGTTICLNCHGDANPAAFTPAGEDTMPPWYGSVTNTNLGLLLSPCSADLEEDLSGDPANLGLDNDGDDAYDTADSDCVDNRPPVAVNDSYTTDEDTTLTVSAPGVLTNDSDPDGDAITAVQVTSTGNGTLTLNADGSFTYSPDLNFFGTDSFTYVANDGQLDSETAATVTIIVNAVNDPPVAVNDAYTTDENVTLNVAAPGVLVNDSDVENDPLTAGLVTNVSNGTLTLNADGSLSYTPNANFNGTDTFTYTANDGQLDSNVATVTITVQEVNLPPVAVNDSYETDEDTTLTVSAPGVLTNDSDPDDDAITAVQVTSTGNGTLTLNADGSFTYTPNLNFFGEDSFTYVANDGQLDSETAATVTITVHSINDPPVADANGPYPGFVGEPVQFDGSGSSDVDGTIASYMWNFGDGNTGTGVNPTHTYTTADSYTVTLTVTDNDGASDTATANATISERAVNLDIAGFRVTKRVSLSRVKPVGIKLVVKNVGEIDEPRPATVTGVQNGIEVYNVSMDVSDAVGDGRTTYELPSYTPTAAGDIMWTATIADDDPDVDEAMATTRVVP